MRWFILLIVCACIGACFMEDEAQNPVTFDRYDANSRYIMTSTAYYCTTSAQFESAVYAHSDGDVIYLTSDDITYEVDDYQGGHNIYFKGDLIGLDANQSKVAVSIWNPMYSRYDLTNIIAWSDAGGVSHQFTNIENQKTHFSIANGDTLNINDCGTDLSYLGLTCAHTNSCLNAFDLTAPIRYLYGWDSSNEISLWKNFYYDASAACDVPPSIENCTPIYHSWIYDSNDYVLDADSSGAIENLDVEYEYYPRSGECWAWVEFTIDWEGSDNDDIATVYVQWGDDHYSDNEAAAIYTAGVYKKKINVTTFIDCDFQWRALYRLCEGEDHETEVSTTAQNEDIVCGLCQ